jgi:hypothetical protein
MLLALVSILPGTPSEYLGVLALGGSIYEASVLATRLMTFARCLSFAFATSAFCLLSLRETASLSFPFLSLSSASFTC